MKSNLLLIFLFTLFISSYSKANSNTGCHNILESLNQCIPYKCIADFFEDKKIEYQIFLSKETNKCKFLEKDLSGITVCDVEKEEVKLLERYLKSILLYNDFLNYNHKELENFRYSRCHFYNNGHDTIVREDEILNKDSIDKISQMEELQQRQKKEDSIKSIFFDHNTINKLKESIRTTHNNTKNDSSLSDLSNINFSKTLTYNIQDSESYNKITSLDSMVYHNSKDWRVWANGKVFQNYQNLFVTNVTGDKITFLWKSPTQEKADLIKNKNVNYLEFTLCKGE